MSARCESKRIGSFEINTLWQDTETHGHTNRRTSALCDYNGAETSPKQIEELLPEIEFYRNLLSQQSEKSLQIIAQVDQEQGTFKDIENLWNKRAVVQYEIIQILMDAG